MYKDGTLTIGDWEKGMADSPYQGFSTVANSEVFDSPGIIKIGYNTILVSTAALTALPMAYAKDANGNNYFITDDAKVYKNGIFSVDLGNIGRDLVIYNDYLIASASNGGVGELSAYGPLSSGAAQWFTSWKTGLDGVYYLKLVPAKDGNLYITNGQYMAKITSFVAGVPTVAPTATLSATAMALPVNNAGVTAVEVGIYLLIGTQSLNGSYFSRNNDRTANLYLWDKSDTKPTSLCGALNENGVNSMISSNGLVYISAGTRGNIYLTDTTSVRKVKRIPFTQQRTFGGYMTTYPNALAFNTNNNLLVGASVITGTTGILGGVWEVNINEKSYPTVFKNQISTGQVGLTANVNIGFIYQTSSDVYFIGWQSGSTYGVDTLDFHTYTSNASYIETQLFFISYRLKRKTFQELEFLLGKPLTTGQEITISYRKNLTDSYTQIGNYTFANLGAVISHNTKALIDDAEMLQLKIQLTQPTLSTFGNNIELVRVTIW